MRREIVKHQRKIDLRVLATTTFPSREAGRILGRPALEAFREPSIIRLVQSDPALLRTGWVTRTNIEHSHFLRYDCWGEVSSKLTAGNFVFQYIKYTQPERISSPLGTSVERALSSFAVQWRPGRNQRAQGMVQDPGSHLLPHPDSSTLCTPIWSRKG